MNVVKVKFRKDEKEESLRPDFENSMVEFAEILLICMTKVRMWGAFMQAEVTSLTEGIKLSKF